MRRESRRQTTMVREMMAAPEMIYRARINEELDWDDS
jgi:hypothetical protein